MNSRERVRLAINHQEADRIPLDLGGSLVTGMNASMVYKLRQALGLDVPGTPVKVIEPYQMLGEIKNDLAGALGVDVVGLRHPRTMFGFRNDNTWKPWTLFDGTPVLVPEGFNTDPEPDGSILMYPEGDKSVAPSGHMPGFDIMNPVQCSAALMDPHELKRHFGERVTFWGGGVDTQQTLPNGTPDDVRAEVSERMRIFGPGGGFVFNTIHNVQPQTPIENLVAMYDAVREYGAYPLR